MKLFPFKNKNRTEDTGVWMFEPSILAVRTKTFCHDTAFIGNYCFIACAELHMDEGSQIDRFVEVSGRGDVHLGKRAVIGSHCTILTSSDKPEGKMNDRTPESERAVLTGDIVLGEDAYVGAHCVIMPGVTIGDRSVVGSGCYIDKDVPADTKVIPRQELLMSARVMKV